jgi:serine/threonine-protein kinase
MQITSTTAPTENTFAGTHSQMNFVSSSTLVGVAINKRYRITELVGTGETSCLYKGFDRFSEKKVLIKVLHKHLTSSEKSIACFECEANEISPLTYPGIKCIMEKNVLCSGQPYVVMERDEERHG